MSLRDIILAVLSGGIALGPVVYGAIAYVGWPERIAPKHRRVIVAVLAGLLSLLTWLAGFSLGYIDPPLSAQTIAEGVWSYGIVSGVSAFMGASIVHGYKT